MNFVLGSNSNFEAHLYCSHIVWYFVGTVVCLFTLVAPIQRLGWWNSICIYFHCLVAHVGRNCWWVGKWTWMLSLHQELTQRLISHQTWLQSIMIWEVPTQLHSYSSIWFLQWTQMVWITCLNLYMLYQPQYQSLKFINTSPHSTHHLFQIFSPSLLLFLFL